MLIKLILYAHIHSVSVYVYMYVIDIMCKYIIIMDNKTICSMYNYNMYVHKHIAS